MPQWAPFAHSTRHSKLLAHMLTMLLPGRAPAMHTYSLQVMHAGHPAALCMPSISTVMGTLGTVMGTLGR